MMQTPTSKSWNITCSSPEDAHALREWFVSHIDLDRVLMDTTRVASGGVVQEQSVGHRLGDYFEDINMSPVSSSVLRLVFHKRPDAKKFWKDLMVNILQEIEAAPQRVSIALDSKGEMAVAG